MGYSIRTEQWRFSQWWWFVSDNRTSKVLTSEPPLGVELYAHDGDRGDVDWHGESVKSTWLGARSTRALWRS